LATRPDQHDGHVEGRRHTDRLDRDVRAQPSAQLTDHPQHVVLRREDPVGAEGGGGRTPALDRVDHDRLQRAEQTDAQDRRQPDRAGADDDHGVPRPDPAVQGPDLEGRGQDVGQHERGLVGDLAGQPVHGSVGEGDPHHLGLDAVDQVPEHPAATALALPVPRLATEPAAAAGADAGHEDAVTGAHRAHTGSQGP
jgi:hypothetical protein